MKERPIIFSGPMVRAILDGRKTQTRRPVKLPEGYNFDAFEPVSNVVLCSRPGEHPRSHQIRCPFGRSGDRLWVREDWAEADKRYSIVPVAYRADGERQDGVWKWTPSFFMPRWASRLTLEVVSVRAQRLQDITEDDARAEGVRPASEEYPNIHESRPIGCTDGLTFGSNPYMATFACKWYEVNGDSALWSSNPWVWAVESRRV